MKEMSDSLLVKSHEEYINQLNIYLSQFIFTKIKKLYINAFEKKQTPKKVIFLTYISRILEWNDNILEQNLNELIKTNELKDDIKKLIQLATISKVKIMMYNKNYHSIIKTILEVDLKLFLHTVFIYTAKYIYNNFSQF